MVTTSNWHEIMNSVSHVKRLQVCILYKTRLPVLYKWFCRLGHPLDILRSFSNDDERRRPERQKSNRFIEQNNKFTSASRFLYFSLPLLNDYAVKFLFCGGREPTQGNDFLVLS